MMMMLDKTGNKTKNKKTIMMMMQKKRVERNPVEHFYPPKKRARDACIPFYPVNFFR